MLKATEAYRIAQEINEVNYILKLIEQDISDAAKEGCYKCTTDVPDIYRKNIDNATSIIKEAGYDVSTTFGLNESKGTELFIVTTSWENAEL